MFKLFNKYVIQKLNDYLAPKIGTTRSLFLCFALSFCVSSSFIYFFLTSVGKTSEDFGISGWGAVVVSIILLAKFKSNGVEYKLIKNDTARLVIGYAIMIPCVVYRMFYL